MCRMEYNNILVNNVNNIIVYNKIYNNKEHDTYNISHIKLRKNILHK